MRLDGQKKVIPLERTITDGIMRWLRANGYVAWKIHGAAYQVTGVPDIILIARNGRFVGLEVKRPRIGRLTELQKKTLYGINRAGGYGAVVTSLNEAIAAITAAEG